MKNTPVRELMERTLIKASPNDSLFEASRKMRDGSCGCLLVGSRDNIAGVITDRDIVIRAIAEGLDPAQEKVGDFMTPAVRTCRETDTLSDVARKMRQHGISRMIVVDDRGRATGFLSFGKIIRMHTDPEEMTEVIALSTGRYGRRDAEVAPREGSVEYLLRHGDY